MPAFAALCDRVRDLFVPLAALEPEALSALVRARWVGNHHLAEESLFAEPVGAPGLFQGAGKGGGQTGSRHAIRVYHGHQFSGVVREAGALLYRGEGRLAPREGWWHCADLDEVAHWHRANGVRARGDEPFDGTVFAQIRHQGAVNEGTVSLTSSFDVAKEYATHGRDEGVVLSIDTATLPAPVFDSYRTMVRLCNWCRPVEFETLKLLVDTLGRQEGVAFLEKSDRFARERGKRVPLPEDLPPSLDDEQIARLAARGVNREALLRLQRDFDIFWAGSYGAMSVLDTDGTEVSETLVHSKLYEAAFERVRDRLEGAARTGTQSHPGWDLTPFGYMAKTCRDREFFSSGPIPAGSVVDTKRVRR